MRVHFELKYGAQDLDEARATAYEKIASFMGVTDLAVPAIVDIELKVGFPDAEKDPGIDTDFVVTAFGNVKHTIAKP